MNQMGEDPSLVVANIATPKQIKPMEIRKTTVLSMARPFSSFKRYFDHPRLLALKSEQDPFSKKRNGLSRLPAGAVQVVEFLERFTNSR